MRFHRWQILEFYSLKYNTHTLFPDNGEFLDELPTSLHDELVIHRFVSTHTHAHTCTHMHTHAHTCTTADYTRMRALPLALSHSLFLLFRTGAAARLTKTLQTSLHTQTQTYSP